VFIGITSYGALGHMLPLNIYLFLCLRQLQRSGRKHYVFGAFVRLSVHAFVRAGVCVWTLSANISGVHGDIGKR